MQDLHTSYTQSPIIPYIFFCFPLKCAATISMEAFQAAVCYSFTTKFTVNNYYVHTNTCQYTVLCTCIVVISNRSRIKHEVRVHNNNKKGKGKKKQTPIKHQIKQTSFVRPVRCQDKNLRHHRSLNIAWKLVFLMCFKCLLCCCFFLLQFLSIPILLSLSYCIFQWMLALVLIY